MIFETVSQIRNKEKAIFNSGYLISGDEPVFQKFKSNNF